MNLSETLSTQYVLGRLSISMPTVSVRLKDEARCLESNRGARPGSLGVSVHNIFEGANPLLQPMQILRTVRTLMNERTVPWTAKTEGAKRAAGPRLIHVNQAPGIDKYVEDARTTFEQALAAITPQMYELELDAAKDRLGALAHQVSWMDHDEFLTRHALSFEIEPFPAFSSGLSKSGMLPAGFVSKLADQYAVRERKLVEFAFEERKTRLLEALENLHNILSTDAKLFASTLAKPALLTQGGIPSLARALGRDSLKVEAAVEAIRSTVNKDVNLVRANSTLRSDIAAELASQIYAVRNW